jgi:transglutaminase-like putative cysteine protease
VTGLASAPPPARPLTRPLAADPGLVEHAVRVCAFLALGGFAAGHWAALVEDAPGGRVAAVVLLAAAGGSALGLLPHLRGVSAGVRALLAGALAAGTALACFAAIGLPLRMLAPGGWPDLGELLDSGLSGLQTVDWPYSGGDEDVRLTLLLAIPAALATAATLTFWPDRRVQPVLRAQALALLLVLYGVAVTERAPSSELLHGALLLVLIAAWLWLPRLGRRQAAPAVAAVAAAGVLALPAAASLDAGRPWIDYESWEWGSSATTTQAFDWDHSYGPIDWPREGATVLNVRSDEAHYWKAETLNQFDGLRWLNAGPTTRRGFEFPERAEAGWNEEIGFTVRELTSDVLVSAGSTLGVDVGRGTTLIGDGTVRLIGRNLEEGDRYGVNAYVPDPSAAEMRAASGSYDRSLAEYTTFLLPRLGETALEPSGDEQGPRRPAAPAPVVSVPLWDGPNGAAEPAVGALARSPYEEMHALARRLAAGEPTVYDVVKRVEGYLQGNLRYDETPPERAYPLQAFVFDDRRGYCQQFSGAMALMLRMNGIPARVASGFSPGLRDAEAGEFRVRDLDAHSWVEVYFDGIGWVPFDPTPSAAPAESQSTGAGATSAARGNAEETGAEGAPRQRERPRAAPGAGAGDGGSSPPFWAMLAAALAPALLVAGALAVVVRARRGASGAEAELEELRYALERLGYEVPAGATLLDLERRLGLAAGPAAARYVRILRERRFAPPGRRTAGGLDRRSLRRALAAPLGPVGRLRGWWALPPRPPGRPFRTT